MRWTKMKNREIILSALLITMVIIISNISIALPITGRIIEIDAKETKIIRENPSICSVITTCADGSKPFDTGKVDANGCPIYSCPSTTCSTFTTCADGSKPFDTGKVDANGCPIYSCPTVPTVCPSGCTCTGETTLCPTKPTTLCPAGCTCTEETTICSSSGQDPIEVEVSSTSGQKRLSLKKVTENSISIEEGSASVTTSGKMIIEEKKLWMETSDGNKEIKIMPSTASETAINQLRLKNYEIVLKEVGKPMYEISGQRDVKVIGLFKSEMSVVSYIDADTGIVENTRKPWWGFLATG